MGTGFVGLVGLFLLNQLVSTVEHDNLALHEAVQKVELTLDVGSVNINVADERDPRPAILERTFTSSLRSPAETVERDRDTFRVRTNCGRLTGDCSTDYQLTVPAKTRVTVRTERGHVTAKGLRAPLYAQVGVGDVRMVDVQGGTITGRSQTGNVTLSDVRFRTAEAATERGQVRVVSTAGFARLRAVNETGDVVVTLPRAGGPYAVAAASEHGRRAVDVALDATAAASVKATTTDGDVTITGD